MDENGFTYEEGPDRKYIYLKFIEGLKVNENEEKRRFRELVSNFTEVNHWWSVVSTRNHGGPER